MGAFHEGHLSLIRRARERLRRGRRLAVRQPDPVQRVVATSTAYPRDEARDAQLAEQIGVDYLFAPPAEEVYPPGFATTVSVAGLTEALEGAHRGRAHFDGVTTVVTKLFNIVGPTSPTSARRTPSRRS